MKLFSKAAAILVASVLCLAFLGCKNSTNEDDGNSISKLETPTNLVINSITDNTISVAVNITSTMTENSKEQLTVYWDIP